MKYKLCIQKFNGKSLSVLDNVRAETHQSNHTPVKHKDNVAQLLTPYNEPVEYLHSLYYQNGLPIQDKGEFRNTS